MRKERHELAICQWSGSPQEWWAFSQALRSNDYHSRDCIYSVDQATPTNTLVMEWADKGGPDLPEGPPVVYIENGSEFEADISIYIGRLTWLWALKGETLQAAMASRIPQYIKDDTEEVTEWKDGWLVYEDDMKDYLNRLGPNDAGDTGYWRMKHPTDAEVQLYNIHLLEYCLDDTCD